MKKKRLNCEICCFISRSRELKAAISDRIWGIHPVNAVKPNCIVLVKEKRTSGGREQGFFAFMQCGIPSLYTSQLWKIEQSSEGSLSLSLSLSLCPYKRALIWDLTNTLPFSASALYPYTCQDDGCLQRLSVLKERSTRNFKLEGIYSMLEWIYSLCTSV